MALRAYKLSCCAVSGPEALSGPSGLSLNHLIGNHTKAMRKQRRKGCEEKRAAAEGEERDGAGRFERRETARAGSREATTHASARQGAVFRDAASHRRRQRIAREVSDGERQRERTAQSSTKVRRDERQNVPRAAGFAAAAEHTEAACGGLRRTATRRRTRVRRAVARTRKAPKRHRAHGCRETRRKLTRQNGKG